MSPAETRCGTSNNRWRMDSAKVKPLARPLASLAVKLSMVTAGLSLTRSFGPPVHLIRMYGTTLWRFDGMSVPDGARSDSSSTRATSMSGNGARSATLHRVLRALQDVVRIGEVLIAPLHGLSMV